MNNIDLNSKQWCELVFEGKNHDFGAYEMRRDSAARHNKAMLIVTILAIVVILLPSIIRFVAPKKEAEEKMTEVTTLSKLPPAEVKQEEFKKPDAPPPPPLKSSLKFTAPVIKKDEEVPAEEEMKTQEEVTQSKVAISIADVKGNDEIHGQDIADLREVAQEKPKEEVEEIFMAAEQMPQFPGGPAALQEFLAKNLRYPPIAAENGISGTVVVRFAVWKDGSIRNIEVLSPVDRSLDEEAVRVIKSMPNWIPGKQNGNNVSVYFTAPVRFQLAEQ